MRKLLLILVLALALPAFSAKQTLATFGTTELAINTQGANVSTYQITNNDPVKSVKFILLDAVTEAPIWSITVPPSTTTPLNPVPTVDDFGQPITFVIGQQLQKNGSSVQTLISPKWEFLTL